MYTYKFKTWMFVLNVVVQAFIMVVVVAIFYGLLKSEDWGSKDYFVFLFGLLLLVGFIDEVFKNTIPYFPKGIALEIHQDYLIIASGNGRVHVPRKGVYGCKEPVSTHSLAPRSLGRVEVSVRPAYKIRHWTGRKINPSFAAGTVIDGNAIEIVKTLRAWRKKRLCNDGPFSC